tara:strand:- start:472 stop:939 length:468 start_codon:yes stop_codon:yes gene_type:complete
MESPILKDFCHKLHLQNKSFGLYISEEVILEKYIKTSIAAIDLIKDSETTCVDLGSGWGIPGIVISMMMKDKKQFNITLYDVNKKKCDFLVKCKQDYNLDINIKNKNIYDEKNLETDIIICKEFLPLDDVKEIAKKSFYKFNSILFHLKGKWIRC